jgi:hypothetical protein
MYRNGVALTANVMKCWDTRVQPEPVGAASSAAEAST